MFGVNSERIEEGLTMFDVDLFITECKAALSAPEPQLVVERLVRDAMTDVDALREALGGGADAVFQPLFRSTELTVANMSTAPGSTSPIHNHCMWGVIGVYAGQEDNFLYRRGAAGLEQVETKSLRTADVYVMPNDLIHAINNPLNEFNAALHVYGGDLVERPGRSIWNPESDVEEDYDIKQVLAYTQQLSG